MPKTIFIIKQVTGDYEDYFVYDLKAFVDKKNALYVLERLQKAVGIINKYIWKFEADPAKDQEDFDMDKSELSRVVRRLAKLLNMDWNGEDFYYSRPSYRLESVQME